MGHLVFNAVLLVTSRASFF